MKKTNRITYVLTAVFSLILFIISALFVGGGVQVHASAVAYTDVLEDLKKDENFNVSNYPVLPINYGLEVIQIAESTAGELFIYVYHPVGETKTLTATTIKFSTSIGASLEYKLYGLTLCNSSGTLYKYVVDDYAVKTDTVRYYDISSIQRKYINNIDGTPDNENTGNEKAYPVGQFWTVCTLNDSVTYNMQPVEVVQVDLQTTGSIRYSNGINPHILSGSACDAHYLAFSTERSIDRLVSADLHFTTQEFERKNGNETLGKKTEHYVTLVSGEFAENPAGGWLGKKAKWDRIATIEEFLSSGYEFPQNVIDKISPYDWILNFYEAPFDMEKNSGVFVPVFSYWVTGDSSYVYTMSGEYVSKVTLMRLEFESEGKVFNLGVVSDIQTGSKNPINVGGFNFFAYVWNCVTKLFRGKATGWETFVAVVALFVCFVVLVLIIGFAKWVYKKLFK